MAISINGGGLKRGRSRGLASLSEINVTPFVDVLLVVLVIFMITANVMEFGLEIDVYMVRVSYNQKPYRRALMESYGARCVASPSEETNSGRAKSFWPRPRSATRKVNRSTPSFST